MFDGVAIVEVDHDIIRVRSDYRKMFDAVLCEYRIKGAQQCTGGDVIQQWCQWAPLSNTTMDLHTSGELTVDVHPRAGVCHGVGACSDERARKAQPRQSVVD